MIILFVLMAIVMMVLMWIVMTNSLYGLSLKDYEMVALLPRKRYSLVFWLLVSVFWMVVGATFFAMQAWCYLFTPTLISFSARIPTIVWLTILVIGGTIMAMAFLIQAYRIIASSPTKKGV